jgi:hypothetical protein
MRKILFLSSTLLGLALAAPGLAQTSMQNQQHTGRGGSAAPDHTTGISGYTGHGRMGTKDLGSSDDTGKGGPSENAGSGNASSGSPHP